jgi:hypothetical protein
MPVASSLCLAVVVLLAACSAAPAPEPVARLARAPAPALAPAPARNPRAPVVVAVEVVSGAPIAGTRMTLHARVDRRAPWTGPIAVEFRLPAGVRRTAGTGATVVSGTADGPDVEIELATVPSDDLVVAASSTMVGAGFHAEARYRFGRPEPVITGPARTGPSTQVNGVDLGPSIPMQP